MKNLTFLLMLFFIAFLYSCKKDQSDSLTQSKISKIEKKYNLIRVSGLTPSKTFNSYEDLEEYLKTKDSVLIKSPEIKATASIEQKKNTPFG